MSGARTAENPQNSWLISVKTVVSTVAAVITILTALVGASAWMIGLYEGLSNRVTVLEESNRSMKDDLRDIKSMLSQLILDKAGNRPDTQRWAK
jgi:predicted PurR-regulated permease PerM